MPSFDVWFANLTCQGMPGETYVGIDRDDFSRWLHETRRLRDENEQLTEDIERLRWTVRAIAHGAFSGRGLANQALSCDWTVVDAAIQAEKEEVDRDEG